GFGIAFARGLLSGESYDLRRIALNALQGGATMAAGIAAGGLISDRSRWLEVANKVTAYRLFVSADRFLLSGPLQREALSAIVRGIAGIDPYLRLWTMEGLGWYWVDRQSNRPAAPWFGKDLPDYARIPLHTGAGLATAQWVLASRAKTELAAAIH